MKILVELDKLENQKTKLPDGLRKKCGSTFEIDPNKITPTNEPNSKATYFINLSNLFLLNIIYIRYLIACLWSS